MNTLILLAAASCAPGADPMPNLETRPAAVPSYAGSGMQQWSAAPQESRPRFFTRLRNLFSRRSQTPEMASPDLAGYSQNLGGSGATLTPGVVASPGISTGNMNSSSVYSQPTFTPAPSPSYQRMPTGQPPF